MINTVLAYLKNRDDVDWACLQHLVLVADCGPHFRSKESAAHFCVTLPKTLGISVEVAWLGEQHGKSGVDRCFGWCNGWIQDYIQRLPIFGLDDLTKCFAAGAKHMMDEDPEGAKIAILKFAPGTMRPSDRFYLACDSFKISRTYSLIGRLSQYASAGVSVRNKVFSDLSGEDILAWTLQTHTPEEPEAWRAGFYDKPKSWEETGPQPGEANSITRRFTDQKHAAHARMPSSRPTFLQRCSAKALSLKRAAAKQKRKQRALRAPQEDSSDSSSSSSASSSGTSEDGSSE